MIHLFLSAALAATPIVHDSPDSAAIRAAVASRTGLPPDQLEPIALKTVLEQPTTALGNMAVRRCAGGPGSMAEARAEIVRAEAALRTGDTVAIATHLDLAVARLGCLTEVVDAPVAARAFLLRGGLAAEQGLLDEARDEIRTALALDPDILWPPAYPVAGTPVLAEVMAETERHTLHVVPQASSGPWINGREIPAGEPLTLRPGLHLAQHSARAGLTSAWLVVRGDATWVLPDALPPAPLDAFADVPSHTLPTVLVATFPEAAGVYVAHRGGLWLATRDGLHASVNQLVAPQPVAPAEEPSGKKKRKKKRR